MDLKTIIDSDYYAPNEKRLYKLIHTVKKDLSIRKKEVEKEISNDNLCDFTNYDRIYHDIIYSPNITYDLIEIEKNIEMKAVILSSPGRDEIKDRRHFIMSIERVMSFMKEQLEIKQNNKDKDYYHYMDYLDDLKAILALALVMPENFDYTEANNLDLLKNYTIPENIDIEPKINKNFEEF